MHFSICVVWCFTMFYHHLQKVIENGELYTEPASLEAETHM